MALSRDDKINLIMLVGGGVLLGIGSIGFRMVIGHPFLGFSSGTFRYQYLLALVFLAVLGLQLWKSNTEVGKIGFSVLTFALVVGLAFPPMATMSFAQLASYVFVGILVITFGVLYYRFKDPSNTLLIAAVAVLALEHALFGFAYTIRGFLRQGQGLFLIAAIVLGVILLGVRNILGSELQKTHDNSQLADALNKVL